MTFSILQLSWRRVYWKDLDESSSKDNSILTLIQFAAKFHEICIVTSLADLALRQIQAYLVDEEGLPFGLLTSVYQISSITYLWSWEFWGGLLERDLRQTYSRRIRLFLLIVTFSFIAALAGPSSAVIMLPRLDWWPISSPILDLTTNYIGNEPAGLWPRNLTGQHLPSADCLSSEGYMNKYCPSVGRSAFDSWDSVTPGADPNITVPVTDTSNVRYLVASRYALKNATRGLSRASTIDEMSAKALSCIWYQATQGIDELFSHKRLYRTSRPVIREHLPYHSHFFKPTVSTQCRSYNINSSEIMFPIDHLDTSARDRTAGQSWQVSPSTWNNSKSLTDGTKFSRVEHPSNDNTPSISAVIVATLPSPRHFSANTNRRVIPCTIQARWTPVEMWIDPQADNSIHEKDKDDSSLLSRNRRSSKAEGEKILIRKSWQMPSTSDLKARTKL